MSDTRALSLVRGHGNYPSKLDRIRKQIEEWRDEAEAKAKPTKHYMNGKWHFSDEEHFKIKAYNKVLELLDEKL